MLPYPPLYYTFCSLWRLWPGHPVASRRACWLGLLYLYASPSGPRYHTVHLICIPPLLHCLFAFHAPALFARHSAVFAKAIYTHGRQRTILNCLFYFFPRYTQTPAMHCVIGDASEIWVSS